MNAKNIISAILMVLSFTACTSEIEGIDDNMTNTGANNGETSISVRMMTEGVSTKADTQSEKLISNYVIAVFEKKSGERVGYASGTADGGSLDTPIVKGINTKAGIVKVIVVANVDNVNDFDNLYTYGQFSTKTVGNLTNLTKVGIKDDVTLSATENKLEVELKQLTARVNVTLNEPEVTGGNNVTVLLLANGLAENPEITEKGEDYETFKAALNYINTTLAKKIAGDGEGATALFEVKIIGAESKEQAVTLSKSVVTSSLTKAAIYGHDANWGRILCAMGYSGAKFDPEKVDLFFESKAGKIQIIENGVAVDYSEEEATKILSEEAVTAIADVKMGDATATAWGCDLTYDYIKINADYRS